MVKARSIWAGFFIPMAKVKPTTLVSDFVGKEGGKLSGICYSHNHYGLYVKTWKKPANPQTAYQTAVRNNYGLIVEAWQGLSNSQYQTWFDLSITQSFSNRLGESSELSAWNLFVKLNTNLLLTGGAIQLIAPVPAVFHNYSLFSFSYSSIRSVFIVTPIVGVSDSFVKYIISLSKPFSPGKHYMKENFAIFGVSRGVFNVTLASYITRFPDSPSPIGLKVFCNIIAVDTRSGLSVPRLQLNIVL
jgi:hypothetical protein